MDQGYEVKSRLRQNINNNIFLYQFIEKTYGEKGKEKIFHKWSFMEVTHRNKFVRD